MDFKNKSDSELITEFKDLVGKERQLQVKILHYLRIIENRKIYLALGFSSLFVFLTEEIGYSEATAYRRILAMRLIQDMPEVEEKLEKGVVSLSVASQFQGFVKKENQKRKLTKRPVLTPQEKNELFLKIEGTSVKKCEQKLIKINPELAIPKEKTKPINLEKSLIQFTVNKELMQKIERLKNLTSHQNPEGKYEILIENLVEIALDKLDPIRREQRRTKRGKENSPTTTQAPSRGPVRGQPSWGDLAPKVQLKPPLPNNQLSTLKVNRYISPKIKDQIWMRDQNKCQFKNPSTGKICGAENLLEIDHRYPFSLSGENSGENLQLRCRAHNQFQARLILT